MKIPFRGYPSRPGPSQLPKIPPPPPPAQSQPPAPPPPPGGYPTPTEHPVRCAAVATGPIVAGTSTGHHRHECIHPAKVPAGIAGILEHRCRCGAAWTEQTARPAPDKSWIETVPHTSREASA